MPVNSPTLLGNRLPQNILQPQQIDNSSWIQVSSLTNFTVGLKNNNTLHAWGVNNTFQVGDGLTTNKSLPVQISTSSFTMISAGSDHSGAITSDNRLFMWGNQPSIQTLTTFNSWTAITAGTSHLLAIRNDGTLWTWGFNTSGQLGDGTTINKSSPVQIGSSSYLAVAAGNLFSLAITTAGRLFAWGSNTNGQLGINNIVNRSRPIQITVSGVTSWIGITAAANNSMAISQSNQLYAWGANNVGQLGDGTIINKSIPVQIGNSSWSQINAANSYSAAIDVLGNLYTWGAGVGFALGNGTSINRSSPTQIATGTSWSQVSVGASHMLARANNSSIFSWGVNNSGQLGLSDTINRSLPIQIGTLSNYTTIAVKQDISGAINNTGQLFMWGLNDFGQLGNNTIINRSSPTQVAGSWNIISTGFGTAAGIDSTNLLYVWGLGNIGQLGISIISTTRSNPTIIQGINFETKSPTLVPGTWNSIQAGLSYTAGMSSNRLFMWGLNANGQLGLGDIVNRSSPTLVTSVSTASDSSPNRFLVSTSGTPLMQNEIIPFANTTALRLNGTTDFLSITDIVNLNFNINDFLIDAWVYITSTSVNNQGIVSKGTAGTNGYSLFVNSGLVLSFVWDGLGGTTQTAGTLTLNTWNYVTVVRTSRVARLYLNGVGSASFACNADLTSTAAQFIGQARGNNPMFGFISNVRIVTGVLPTGYNSSLSTITVPTVPTTANANTQLLLLTAPNTIYQTVYVGFAATYALDSNYNLFTWGLANAGQISGNNQTINRSRPVLFGNQFISSNTLSPIQISAESWSKVSAGTSVNSAIHSDGRLFTWGSNAFGQLGDNTIITKSSPTQISTSSWSQISVNSNFMLGVALDGTAYGWGQNGIGQLGDSTLTSRSNPVFVGSTVALRDFSPNNFSPTSTGSPVIRTDIFPITGTYSGAFNGSSLLTFGASIAWALGGTATIECYVYVTSFTSTSRIVSVFNDSVSIDLYVDTVGSIGVHGGACRTTSSITLNNWFHIAVVYNSTNIAIYFNGVSQPLTGIQFTFSITNSGSSLLVAAFPGPTTFLNGYLSNLRIVKGTAVYTTNFTPPTSPLTAISGTELLMFAGLGAQQYRSVSAGSVASYGIGSDSVLYAWGQGSGGLLGNGFNTANSRPIVVSSQQWDIVNGGVSNGSAIRRDGFLFAWGAGTVGQLANPYSAVTRSNISQVGGNYPIGNVPVPTKIDGELGTASWTFVSAGEAHTGAISNQRLFTWGLNNTGQLGDNTTINRSSPTLVTGTYLDVSAGNSTTLAVSLRYPTGQ